MKKAAKQYPLDKVALDREYSPSLLVDSLDAYLEQYAVLSANTCTALSGQIRACVSYGPHDRHRLDFFGCGQVNAPVVIFIHGGFWSALDQSSFSFPASKLIPRGIHYVSMTYRLAPEASLSDIVEDVALGLRWLEGHAARLGIDIGRIVLAGHSAGAHLAAMMLTRQDARHIAGALLVSGVYDLAPVQRSYVNDTVAISDHEVECYSPISLSPAQQYQVDIVVGEHETDAFKRQSDAFFKVWSPALPDCRHAVLPALNHFDILFDLAKPGSALFHKVLNLCKGKPV